MTHLPENVATVAIVGFLALEAVLRKGKSAKSWQSESDRGTTFLLLLAYLVIGAALSLRLPGITLPLTLQWVGAGLAFTGLALRVAAFRTLGSSYSRTLRVNEDQALVTTGIYRHVRHPGYLSSLLLWLGAVTASGSLVAVCVVAVALFAAYTRRIQVEERLLAASFGEAYTTYQHTSWKLVPHLY